MFSSFLPFAFVSEIVPVFSRKAIFGYPIMVAATLCIGFISMSVWAHHMFTIGMSAAGNTFFVLTTMAIAVPTGIKIFNWLATMWGGQIQYKAPMLFCVAFLFQFLVAGLTGIMLGAAPFNWQLSGSYFVIAHFHYVIVGGILFALFAAFYYWFPKMSGRVYNEALGNSTSCCSSLDFISPSTSCIFRAFWDASANLYVRAGPRLGHIEPDCHQ
jgi:cytochrome c oxidase subunit 1